MWLIQRKQDNAVMGTVNAPKDTDVNEIVQCFNGTHGLEKEADVFKASWLPEPRNWKSLKQMWTPMTDVVEVDNRYKPLTTLRDQNGEGEIEVEFDSSDHGVFFRFDGYGEKTSADGFGSPVGIEFYNNELRVIVWNDINQEDPQIISLENAREFNRDPEGDYLNEGISECVQNDNHLKSVDSDGFCNACGEQ